MTRLSIVIVNYNVKYFLFQLLHSLERACKNISHEIIIVDNASVDGSVDMIKSRFPQVKLIANKENTGFSKANNQGIEIATGEYILLLNPDTVVAEGTFEKCLAFMDKTPDAGALGVRMYDGKGRYLPESKRGHPTPWVSFCKISGLTSFFPNSKTFAGYYLGHLSPDETHEIDVLAGAYMFLRRSALEKSGLLDETFFMYGEDVDLSYRIRLAGYKNYYFPDASIIHYKGESTKKGSLNYVKVFYQAMDIFAKKHFSPGKAKAYHLVIRLAIYGKAMMEGVKRVAGGLFRPFIDAVMIYIGMFLLQDFWSKNVMGAEAYYPNLYLEAIVPAYVLTWIIAIYFSGGYDKPFKIYKLVRGGILGTILIAIAYAFLDESLRYSRALIVLGGAWTVTVTVFSRIFSKVLENKSFDFAGLEQKKIVIVGELQEAKRVLSLLSQFGVEKNFAGFVQSTDSSEHTEHRLGKVENLDQIVELFEIDEVIFCSKSIPYAEIIKWMTKLGKKTDFKIVSPESESIVGSNSKDAAGDLYAVDINLAIQQPYQVRNKRMLDVLLSFLFLLLSPFVILFVRSKGGFMKNMFNVIAGKKSLVGYAPTDNENRYLPSVKKGVLSPLDRLKQKKNQSSENMHRLNLLYARDYSVYKDLSILLKGFKNLGET